MREHIQRGSRVWSDYGSWELVSRGSKFVYQNVRRTLLESPIYIRKTGEMNRDHRQTYWVDPRNITETVDRRYKKYVLSPNGVFAGRWDKRRLDFHERTIPKSLVNHFERDIPWEQTAYFETRVTEIGEAGSWRGCTSKSELLEHLQFYEELYRRFERDGYKTQRELLGDRPEETRSRLHYDDDPLENEIRVALSRDGEPLWITSGQHRLALAKILELDEVAVQVFSRHSKAPDDVSSALDEMD